MRRPVSGKCCKPAVPEPDILNLNELRIPNHHAVEPQLNVLGARAAPFDDGPSVHLAAKIIKDVSVPGCWHVNFRERAKVDLCDKAERLFQRAPDHYGARLEARSGAVDLSPDEQGPIRRAAPAQGALRRAEIKPVDRLCLAVPMEQADLHLFRSAICLRLMDGSAQRYAGGDNLLPPPIDHLGGALSGYANTSSRFVQPTPISGRCKSAIAIRRRMARPQRMAHHSVRLRGSFTTTPQRPRRSRGFLQSLAERNGTGLDRTRHWAASRDALREATRVGSGDKLGFEVHATVRARLR